MNKLFFYILFCITASICMHQSQAQTNAVSTSSKAAGNGDEDAEMFNRGKQRDQQAIDEAMTGWWTASMRNHDERIAWWKEARFGMFIHWGVYSLPGGEWKGHKVDGYAEHLMRKEQISRKDYLELAHQFNPEKFDAVKWVSYAKQAGMKYIIITAKHHDGFAMFDSKVSDYNIVRQTPFARDPMVALAAACKAQGIRFGFYYSHAFDWEDPDAPGNDWDYDNPGGDKGLHGGAHWFDLHPELLPKAQRYVDQKAIPQIRELIARYHPDILWFDTPGKLPLSENIRILKAIREVDSTVVVNGRLARSADNSFGDYKNTADRPEEFFPVTGDWEAIPTTNESYGYHQYDKSHKPVAHFIQLLAKSASRGGNLLMNIGPKGDGTFDAPDLHILQGIGNWMEQNAESIYGTSASPLPLQNWGVSTMKGNKLYLHVFNWPSDGKLYLGGLKSDAAKIYFLAGAAGSSRSGAPAGRSTISGSRGTSGRRMSGNKLTAARLNDKDIVINVPMQAPDTVNTVIVMEFNKTPQTDTNRFVAPNVPLTRLLAFDAMQHGTGLGFGDGKTNKYYVDGWKNKDQYLSWNFRTAITASYCIDVRYLAGEGSGGSWHWQLDGAGGDNRVVPGSKGNVVSSVTIGTLSLSEGMHALSIHPVDITGQDLMKLLEVRLVAIKHPDALAVANSGPTAKAGPVDLPEVFAAAGLQTRLMLREIDSSRNTIIHVVPASASSTLSPTLVSVSSSAQTAFSPRTLEHGELKLVASRDWTSGFFPGILWMLYEYTHDMEWKREAEVFTAKMETEKTNGTTHDMGFKIMCSVGNGYRITNGSNQANGKNLTNSSDLTNTVNLTDSGTMHYKEVILQAARTLSTRFSPVVGCIRSWDHHRNLWGYPVIIDNMMNLELLFTATRLSGDSSFYKIAVSHANTTMRNHYRPDYSSYHVVDYDSATGRVVKRMTWQGYSDSSAWARGQAWGLYAYTMCFRETGDSTYLRHAEHIAAFILHHPHLPADKVPFWDFDAPAIPVEPRDASAAAVIASGLYELSRYSSHSREYRSVADTILISLTHRYRAQPGEAKGFILLHSTGSKPSGSEVDVPLNYADYYYLEALLRSVNR
jgi:alpha-L-fucosidase